MLRLLFLAALCVACSGASRTVDQVPTSAKSATALEVDLSRLGVVADDPSRASENRVALQRAIDAHDGSGAILVLPRGVIYLDRGAHYDSLRFGGVTDVTLAGRRVDQTKIVIEGDATGGYWVGIEVYDGAKRIVLRDFTIEHGNIENPSPTLQNHLIQVNAQRAITSDIEIHDVKFGPTIGDAIRVAGTDPNYVERLHVHHFVMMTNGHPMSPKQGSRSGLSLQRGFKDVEIHDFYIYGAKNSPIDMEPTAAAPMERLTIRDGIIDNRGGVTVYAASIGGWEDSEHRVYPLRDSKIQRVLILEGQLNLINTENLEVSDVTMIATSHGPMASSGAPLVYAFHHTVALKLLRNVLIRGIGAGTGPLLLVTHGTGTFPTNIEIEGGTWISRVAPDVKGGAYLGFESVQGVSIRNLRLELDGDMAGPKFGIRFRSSARSLERLRIENVSVQGPAGKLAAAIWIAATNANAVNDISIRNVSAVDIATVGVLFDSSAGSTMEAAPVLEGNEFGRSSRPWNAVNMAAGRVVPTERLGKVPSARDR